MKIDYNKLNEATGAGLFRPSAVLLFAQKQIDFLYTHNKNYTRTQWEAVALLKEIINNIHE